MTSELKPCPFCGGQAERIEVREDDGFENRGGVAIECRQCRASSHVEFGRVENLVSSWNTRATPSADTLAGLVRYDFHDDWSGLIKEEAHDGEYVLHSEASAVIAAKDAEIERLTCPTYLEEKLIQVGVCDIEWQKRAEAAEAELAQIKYILKDGNAVHIAMLRGDIAKPTKEQINHIYAAPVSDNLKAENERLREALREIAGIDDGEEIAPSFKLIARDAIKGDSNDKG